MIKLITAGIILSLVSCARRGPESQSPETANQSTTTSGPAITLERTACFGRCPVYTITVFPSGEVKYEGKTNVRLVGTATGRVSPALVDSLLTELDQGGYFSFAESYTSGQAACGRYATDSPTVITSATLRGRTKRVAHDYGCSGAPGGLVVLERRIDEALNSGQWTGR